jgi:acyl carrier protein
MNEEISRILRMLEEGRITAAEAELLIRAVKEGSAPPPPGTPPPRPRPRGDLCDLFGAIARAISRAERRQRRYSIWSFLQQVRIRQEERRERINRMSAAERVRYVFDEIVLPDVEEIKPGMRLREDLHLGSIARDNLRFGLEAEFDIRIPVGEALDWKTVQDVMDYIARVTGGAQTPPPSADTPQAPTPPAEQAPDVEAGPEKPDESSRKSR